MIILEVVVCAAVLCYMFIGVNEVDKRMLICQYNTIQVNSTRNCCFQI